MHTSPLTQMAPFPFPNRRTWSLMKSVMWPVPPCEVDATNNVSVSVILKSGQKHLFGEFQLQILLCAVPRMESMTRTQRHHMICSARKQSPTSADSAISKGGWCRCTYGVGWIWREELTLCFFKLVCGISLSRFRATETRRLTGTPPTGAPVPHSSLRLSVIQLRQRPECSK